MQRTQDDPASENLPRENSAANLSTSEDSGVKERRALPRFAVEDRATVLVLSQGVRLVARIVEVSEGGCRLQVPRDFRVGVPERIEVAFQLNRIAFRLGGVTQWSDGRGTLGVGFLAMADRHREDLRLLIAELREDAMRRAARETEQLAVAEKAAAQRTAHEETQPRKDGADLSPGYDGAEALKTFLNFLAPPGQTTTQPILSGKPRRVEPEQIVSKSVIETGPVTRLVSPATSPQRPMPLGLPQPPDLRKAAANSAATPAEIAPVSAPTNVEGMIHPAKAHGRPARERRQQQRHAVDTHAVLYFIDVAARERGRILDVSMSGCRIRTEERFPSGIYRRVETEFKIDGLPFRLAGVVQSMHDRHTVGIRFLNMSERKRSYLQELMEEIEEMRHSGLWDQHESPQSQERPGL